MQTSAMDYLQDDHRRLDRLMTTCRELMEQGDAAEAGRRFEEFRRGLIRHIKIEEGILFPAFEKATGSARRDGPTGVMRVEHEEILRLLGLIREVFEAEDPPAGEFESLRSQLVTRLAEHNLKEERIIYPGVDREVPPDTLVPLVRSMREFPE